MVTGSLTGIYLLQLPAAAAAAANVNTSKSFHASNKERVMLCLWDGEVQSNVFVYYDNVSVFKGSNCHPRVCDKRNWDVL